MSISPLFAQTERQELAVPVWTTILGSLGLTALLYGLAYPLKKTALGLLLFERGLTQILVVFLGIFIALYLGYRLYKIRGEFKHLNQEIIPANIFRISPTHPGLTNLQQALLQEKSLLTRRCSRVIGAYQQSQGRRAAAEFAQEDSVFYQQMMASAYALPRILLWSIPLLGLIGTLLGIGAAVQGFSHFLEQAANLEQVRGGFATVAGGLTVAFDATLAALGLSVLGMVFLSLVERQESQLLLLVDIYIADKILPRLQEPDLEFPQTDWRDSLEEVVQELLPRKTPAVPPKAIGPELGESFMVEVQNAQKHLVALLEGIYQSHQEWQRQSQVTNHRLETMLLELSQERQSFPSPALPAAPSPETKLEPLWELAQTFRQELLGGIDRLEALLQNQSFQTQASQEQSAQALRESLEGYGQRLDALVLAMETQNRRWTTTLRELQPILERLAQAPPESEQLTAVLAEIGQNLTALRPSLDRLNTPRRLLLFEQEDPSHETPSP